jgi:Holliday junction resolvase RusA-like endonuclease
MSYASVHFDTPPSVNRIWRPIGNGFARTAEYRSWRASAGVEVMAARKGGLKFVEPVAVVIIAKRHSKTADLDNLIKPALDALQFGQLIENDNQVEHIAARWAQEFDLAAMNGRDVRVEIRSC